MESAWDLLWVLPVLLLSFPVFAIGIWILVSAILSTVSGYRSLATFRIDREEANRGVPLSTPWFAWIGPVAYRGRTLSLRCGSGGLTLLVSRLFPFHKPVRVPWERIRLVASRGFWGRPASDAVLLDDRVRLRVPEEVVAAIRDAMENLSASPSR